MSIIASFDKSLIAPCGINCGTCISYLRARNKCFGCRVNFDSKRKTCRLCKIKNCEHLAKGSLTFCNECEIFPCDKIKYIDKRYRTKYMASLIENLVSIKEIGIEKFLVNEAEKWKCLNCGSTLSVHLFNCPNCGVDLRN
jgi:hypothetical protein